MLSLFSPLCRQICANVMEYCESLMLQSAPSFQHTVCLFTPSLSESTNRDGPRQGEIFGLLFYEFVTFGLLENAEPEAVVSHTL